MVNALPIHRGPPLVSIVILTRDMLLPVSDPDQFREEVNIPNTTRGLLVVFRDCRDGSEHILQGEVTYFSFIIVLFCAP